MEDATEVKLDFGQVKGGLLFREPCYGKKTIGKWVFAQKGDFNKVNWTFTGSFLARSDLERLLKSFGYINVKPTNREGKHSPLQFV